MNIDKYIKKEFSFYRDGVEISKKLPNAHVDLTFWGGRVVRVDGFEGSIDLDTLASAFNNDAKSLCRSQFSYRSEVVNVNGKVRHVSVTKRLAGTKIIEKVREFYQITDTKLAQANWFTNLCHWARSFFSSPTHRQNIESADAIMYFTAFPGDIFDRELECSPIDWQSGGS